MAVLGRNIQHVLLSSDAHSGIPSPCETAVQIQEGGKDYLLSERSEKVNKVIQGKSEAVWARGKAGWLVPHGEEMSAQIR